jgi:hypothetical protein
MREQKEVEAKCGEGKIIVRYTLERLSEDGEGKWRSFSFFFSFHHPHAFDNKEHTWSEIREHYKRLKVFYLKKVH